MYLVHYILIHGLPLHECLMVYLKAGGRGPGINSSQSKNVGEILLSMQLADCSLQIWETYLIKRDFLVDKNISFLAWKQLHCLEILTSSFKVEKRLLIEYFSNEVLKQPRILNFTSVIDIVGGDYQCFVYTGSGCSYVLMQNYTCKIGMVNITTVKTLDN